MPNLFANHRKEQVEVRRVDVVLETALCALVLWPWMRQKQCVQAAAPPFQEGKSSNQQPGRGRLEKTHARLDLLFHLSHLLLVHGELQDEGRGDGQRAHSQKALA